MVAQNDLGARLRSNGQHFQPHSVIQNWLHGPIKRWESWEMWLTECPRRENGSDKHLVNLCQRSMPLTKRNHSALSHQNILLNIIICSILHSVIAMIHKWGWSDFSPEKKPGSFGCHKLADGKLLVSLQHVRILEVTTPILTIRKKAEETENQQFLLGPSKNWGHSANPKIERYKLTDTKNHSLLSGADTTTGTSTRAGKHTL